MHEMDYCIQVAVDAFTATKSARELANAFAYAAGRPRDVKQWLTNAETYYDRVQQVDKKCDRLNFARVAKQRKFAASRPSCCSRRHWQRRRPRLES